MTGYMRLTRRGHLEVIEMATQEIKQYTSIVYHSRVFLVFMGGGGGGGGYIVEPMSWCVSDRCVL